MNKISLLAALAIMGSVAGCDSNSKQPEYVAMTPPLNGTKAATNDAMPGAVAMPNASSTPSSGAGAPAAPSGMAANSPSTPDTAAPAQVQPSGTVVTPPGMSGGTSGNLTPTPELDKRIASLVKQGKDKKAIAAAYADRGYERMMDDPASPKIKYRAALQDFHAALKYDPTNTKAQQNKDMIEGIYRSMHRPIPE